MKRRAFITSLFATAAVAAIADPAQAVQGRRRRRGARRARRGTRMARRSSKRRSAYQPVSYRRQPTISTGVSVAPSQPTQRVQRPAQRPAGVNRNLPEFWRSPGEIDRPIVAKMQQGDIQGKSRAELIQRYGAPMRDEGSSLTWNVGRTSDGIIAPQTVTVQLNNGKGSSFRRGF